MISSSSSSGESVYNIEISNITIKAPTNIAWIKLLIESTAFKHKFYFAQHKSKEITLPLPLPSLPSESTPLIIKVGLDGIKFLNRYKQIEIKSNDLLYSANKQEYRTTANGIEAIIEFIPPQILSKEAPSRSVTDEIFEMCPRFRVLVIGKTGAGKSSLINKTFGVTDAQISPGKVGECDINKEHFSVEGNKRFVLHDSKGFEPGEANNYDTVIKFLNDRKNMTIKDQVHAVWLCFSISVAGDRLFETGSENFLQMLSERLLGKMPIIAIFTKFDMLVDHIEIYEEYTNPERRDELINAKLDELCVKPFEEQIHGKTKIRHIAVSTNKEYTGTLHKLTQLTTQLVREYLTEDVALLSAVAQQVSPTVKLDAVIAVGRKRYWRALAAIIELPGNQLQMVLQHIHQDIVRIWNLQDPFELLDSSEFKKQVVAIVNTEQDVLSLKNMAPPVSIVGALAALAGVVLLPITAGFVIGHWTVLLFKQTGIVLQQLMIYIVALTIIMQTVFAVTTSTNNVVTRPLIDLALHAFGKCSQREVIPSIQEFMQRPGSYGRDAILQKITELIKSESNRISPEDLAEIKNQFEPDDR
jgi:GTPase Era involved in 16S rRNA processing